QGTGERGQVLRRHVRAIGGRAARGQASPVRGAGREGAERELPEAVLVLGVREEAPGDPGPPEDLVVDVVVVVTSAGFLDDRTQKQVPGVAVFVDGARDCASRGARVDRG